jgi:hypothetical protein
MAETTERFDTRRALFLERLIKAWDKTPKARLGQLIIEAIGASTLFDIEYIRNVDDVKLVEAIERWVLTGDTIAPPSSPRAEE